MRWNLLASLLGVVLPWSVLAQPAFPDSVSAEGRGEVRVAPDVALVRIGVQREAAEAGRAQAEASAAMGRVIHVLRQAGLSSERIATESLELAPIHDPEPSGTPSPPRGFRAVQRVRAEVPIDAAAGGPERVGRIVDRALAAGASQLEGIQFDVADRGPHRLKALRLAAEDARRSAQAIAEALGRELGPVLVAEEGGVSFVGPPSPMLREAAAPTPVEPGKLELTAAVRVRYRLGTPPAKGP